MSDAQQLQEELRSLQLWEGTWLLKFSISKDSLLCISIMETPQHSMDVHSFLCYSNLLS